MVSRDINFVLACAQHFTCRSIIVGIERHPFSLLIIITAVKDTPAIIRNSKQALPSSCSLPLTTTSFTVNGNHCSFLIFDVTTECT